MAEETNNKEELKLKRETIQLEREELRKKIAEIIEANYDKLEREAEKLAPGFDYEKEAEELKAEEAAELAAFEWADGTSVVIEEEKDEAVEAAELGAAVEAEKPAVAASEGSKAEYGPLPKAKVSHSKYPKPARVYKSAAAKALIGDKHRRTLTAAVALLMVFAAYQAWDYLVPKTVNIDYVTFDGTEQFEYATTARTAAGVMDELAKEGSISMSSNDLLDTNGEMPVKNDMTVDVRQSKEAKAKIAGEASTLMLVPGTVEENLKLNEVSYDEDDEIKPALDKKVNEKTKITVNEIHYKVKEKTEKVEAVDKVILDPGMTSGVQETEEGNDGEGVFTYTTKYVNGKKKGTKRDVKEWITEPHDNVLRLGTSATGTTGEYIVTRTFTANTTAYTASAGARGALGQGVHVGTCAVDPGFVSLRSELWVEGYGYAYANDTGGAVKGNVVDLYMSSRGQCISWGRRNVTAYVIVPEVE